MTMLDTTVEATTPDPAPAARRRRRGVGWWLLPLIGIPIAIAIWALLTEVVFAHRTLVPEFSPARTWGGMSELWSSGVLVQDASASVFRLIAGLAISIVVGVGLGFAIGSARWLEQLTRPTFLFLRMVSPLSWAPLVIALLGIGDIPVIVLVAATTVWPITMSTATGVQSIPKEFVAVARSLGSTRWERFRSVTVPAVRPHVLSGIRLAIGIGWVVLVPAEMLGVTSGLGYQILNAKDQLAYHHITALIIVIGTIGFAIDVMARWLLRTPRERRDERLSLA